MECKIRFFRGAIHADLKLEKVSLLAGQNEAGKSSVCEAVAAALTSSPIPFFKAANPDSPLVSKKDMPELVHSGSEHKVGGALLRDEQGMIQVSWPKCDIETQGTPAKSSKVAAGLISPLEFEARERARYFGNLLRTQPTKDEYFEALTSAGLVIEDFEKYYDPIWSEIEIQGWDAVYKNYKDKNTRLTGQWEGVTGDRYGDKKAVTYLPEGWVKELQGQSVEAHAEELADAKQKVDNMVGQSAASQSDIDQLAAQVDAEKQSQAKVEKAKQAVSAFEPRLNRLRKDVQEAQAEQAFTCDHCGGVNVVVFNDEGLPTVTATDKTEAEIAEAQDVIKKAKVLQGQAEVEYRRLEIEVQNAKNEAARYAGAAERLAAAKKKKGSRDDLDLARDYLASVERQHGALKKKIAADAIHKQKVELDVLLTVLEPQGLRHEKMVKLLSDFNQSLAKFSAQAKFGQVSVTDDLEFQYRGMPYFLLSKSAKFRVQTIVQVACAVKDESDVLVIDGADILDQAGRNGLLGGLLPGLEIPALVAMTLSKPEQAPDLAAHGMGRTYWMSEGVAKEKKA